jgi:rod shape-determining protein MreD
VKRAAALLLVGLLIPVAQGAVAPFLPSGACPDLGLLLVIGFGVSLRSTAAGIAVAAWIGFVSDLLSGSLLGQHALLRVLAFGAARLTSLHMNMRGPFTQMALGGALTLLSALGTVALTAFFASGAASFAPAAEIAWHTAVNAAVAPLAVAAVGRLLGLLGEDDGRRVLRLEPRGWST